MEKLVASSCTLWWPQQRSQQTQQFCPPQKKSSLEGTNGARAGGAGLGFWRPGIFQRARLVFSHPRGSRGGGVCCTPTSAESGPGGRSPTFLEEAPRRGTQFLEARCSGAAGAGELRFLSAPFPLGRGQRSPLPCNEKPDEPPQSQPSPCSLAVSPSQAGGFLHGSDPAQAAPPLPCWAGPLCGQHEAQHPANASLAPLAWHKPPPPSSSLPCTAGGHRATPCTRSRGRPSIVHGSPPAEPEAWTPPPPWQRHFFLYLSIYLHKREILTQVLESRKVLRALSVLRLQRHETPQPTWGPGTRREAEKLRFPPHPSWYFANP